ncbi:MAG: GIY-YIG nuclease family protein [Anaerolineales bacterium]|nr:GIY-YIG nuclease family protein [Anaerolineales bacterium]
MTVLRLPAEAGSYVLVLRLARPRRVRLGGLGWHRLPAGWYLYVGSARGPGGLAARVGRHLRRPAAQHWHIDYLRRAAGVTAVWWRVAPDRLECAWADAIAGWPGAAPAVPGFGASDCRCLTHLWRVPGPPARPAWAAAAGTVAGG